MTCEGRRCQMSMSAKITIFRNKRDEEVARVTFDETFPRGWRIESKAHQSFDHKFSTELEASKPRPPVSRAKTSSPTAPRPFSRWNLVAKSLWAFGSIPQTPRRGFLEVGT